MEGQVGGEGRREGGAGGAGGGEGKFQMPTPIMQGLECVSKTTSMEGALVEIGKIRLRGNPTKDKLFAMNAWLNGPAMHELAIPHGKERDLPEPPTEGTAIDVFSAKIADKPAVATV